MVSDKKNYGVKFDLFTLTQEATAVRTYKRLVKKMVAALDAYGKITVDFERKTFGPFVLFETMGRLFKRVGYTIFQKDVLLIGMTPNTEIVVTAQIIGLRCLDGFKGGQRHRAGPLEAVLNYFGKYQNICNALEVSRQALYYWQLQGGVPIWALHELYKLSNGELSADNVPTVSHRPRSKGGRKKTSPLSGDCESDTPATGKLG